MPSVFDTLSAGTKDLLLHPFLKIGPLPITLLFLLKASVFLFLLISVSKSVQRALLGRLLRKDGQDRRIDADSSHVSR